MKKISLLIALISFGAITAQTEKGSFMISGKTGLGFTSATVEYEYEGKTTDGPKTTSFSISPSAGYFIIDNLSIGLEFDYTATKIKQEVSYIPPLSTGYNPAIDFENTQNTFAIIPTATYFFSKEKFRPFIEAGMGYATIKNETKTLESSGVISTNESDGNGLVWGGGGGIAYFISQTICFDLGISYSQFTYEEKDIKTKSGILGANIGISIFLK
ncbi:outer membrane beta-barrel protein [Flavobacterium aquicola]|uniref:Outer membrane protein n=1 Tax=Flavobacterium aquicola TaxID=1682742 RepID=A0A3E0EDK1_9FLAO|nr:outer membrane beta-barrel protein [Flavobacterium aquicola]REG96284.1 outer membrane protein [Flavobacterium aquicola]